MALSDLFDLTSGGELSTLSFQFSQLPGLDVPHVQTAQIAANRARQISRRATAASLFSATVGSVTRRSLTREGERPVVGTFETPQELPESSPMMDLTGDFNSFLSAMGLT